MSLGRGKDEVAGQRMTALVVEADPPLDNKLPAGRGSRGTVRILVDGDPPTYVARGFKLTRERWLVPGMEIPVTLDPAHPDRFEVDWGAIPPIEDRVAANDPALSDPRGARRRMFEAVKAAGAWGPDLSRVPGGMGKLAARAQETQDEATPDRFAEALEKAAQQPAPPGKTRAVVLISTMATRLVQQDAEAGGAGNYRESSGKHDAVLAVSVPGQAPYAVLVRKLKRPRGRGDAAGAGLPALVSSSDPTEVEILWDELPSVENQVGQRIADKLAAASAGMAEETQIESQMAEAVGKGTAPPPAPGAGMPQITPQMQRMMAQNAKQALAFVQDPAQREMLIRQYRAAGIPIDEEG